MATTSTQVLNEVLELMTGLAGDWEYEGTISADTRLFDDLGLQSLDLVVLGTTLQDTYGRVPFAEFLADMGKRASRVVMVGELASFVDLHRAANSHFRTRGTSMTVTLPPSGPVASNATRTRPTGLANRILLIGLDGATFTILEPLMRA